MSDLFSSGDALKDFHGVAPVFPLPDVVLFPHALLPLHIFEPRYREMMSDAIARNRLIVLARLRPGHQELYHTKSAPIFPVACLGRVTADQRLPDGRYYLILEGIVRVRIDEELDDDKPYRVARMTMIRNRTRFSEQFDAEAERTRLLTLCRRHLGEEGLRKNLMSVLESDVKLGTLCDILAYACPFPVERKQHLLEEAGVERRCRMLSQFLAELIESSGERDPFPPRFSAN